jgi:hypothetical protein
MVEYKMHKLYRNYSKINKKSFQKLKGGAYEEPGDLDKIISVDRGPIAIEVFEDRDWGQFTIQGKIVELDRVIEVLMRGDPVTIRRVSVVIENIYPDNPQTREIKAVNAREMVPRDGPMPKNLLLVWKKDGEDVTSFFTLFKDRRCKILGQELVGRKKKKEKPKKKKPKKKKPKKKKPTKKKSIKRR